MADWIEEVAQRESDLIAAGVSPSEAMRVAALFADALAKADRAKRKAQQEREAAKLLHLGADTIMTRQQCSRATAYNRAARGRASKQTQAG